MKSATKGYVASEFMQRDIVTVTPSDTLREALALMTANHITGLPVMDEQSRCIGLITASDILNYEQDHDSTSDESSRADVFDSETERWESVPLSAFAFQEFGHVRVSDVMTRELIWVGPNTTLQEVARQMINQRVHRILVMDAGSRLYGVLSAYDLVRFVAEG